MLLLTDIFKTKFLHLFGPSTYNKGAEEIVLQNVEI